MTKTTSKQKVSPADQKVTKPELKDEADQATDQLDQPVKAKPSEAMPKEAEPEAVKKVREAAEEKVLKEEADKKAIIKHYLIDTLEEKLGKIVLRGIVKHEDSGAYSSVTVVETSRREGLVLKGTNKLSIVPTIETVKEYFTQYGGKYSANDALAKAGHFVNVPDKVLDLECPLAYRHIGKQ